MEEQVAPASSTTACLDRPGAECGTKSGYTFAAVGNGTGTTGFEVNGTPVTVGTTGQRAFCSDQSGVIQYNTTGTAVGTGAGSCAAVGNVLQ